MAKAHTLVDNFNDNSTNTSLWTVTNNSRVQETNGRVEIRPLGNQASSYVEYVSLSTYDLTDSAVHVELVRTLIRSSRTTTYLTANIGNARLTIAVNADGMLRAGLTTANGVSTVLSERPYDPARHRWLRLRDESGTVYWEVSGDGEAWTVLASQNPRPFDLSVVTLRFGAGTFQPVAAPGTAIFDNFNVLNTSLSRRVEERRISARGVRDRAAALAESRRHEEHANNNDEVNYAGRPFIGNYSKGLKHDSVGDPDPVSYGTMLRALQSEDPADFEEIALSSTAAVKLTNPQAGLAFDIAGPDAQAYTMPPAPRFDSEQAAHEAGELYWMAVARDVPFTEYGTSPVIANAILSLGGSGTVDPEFRHFGGTVPVTAQNVFRGIYPGEQVGPYVSQFLLKGTNNPDFPDGEGRDADEGFITYGLQTIDQRQLSHAAGVDYLTSFNTWLAVQNGADARGQDQYANMRRFIRSLRDGASYVHFDQVINAFYNAAMILLSEPAGNQLTTVPDTGRVMVDLEFPKDQGNPYDPPGAAMDSRTQAGFATFGPIHLLQVLSEVLGRALRAVWWQKWGVHRRLRPEEYGGRVDNWIMGRRDYPIHPSIKDSLMTGGLAGHFGGQTNDAGNPKFTSYLLPQAYPEGAPTHPAYGAGHAAGAGACATILKAFFDEGKAIENPRQVSSTGLTLEAYTGADAGEMTVGGELNKLAGNIALFRSAAGVHWRSDYTESLPFGEAIAIGLLQEMSLGFNEDDAFFELTKFDGQKIRIFDGKVVPVES